MPFRDDQTTERRSKLDGGLNSRDNPFRVAPDQVVDVSNFRSDEGGSLTLRDGAYHLNQYGSGGEIQYPHETTGGSRTLPAPTIVNGGVGSIPAATYTCKLIFVRWGGPVTANQGDIGATSVSNSLVLGAPAAIRIIVDAVDLGERAGTTAGSDLALDCPFMGGLSSGQVRVYLRSGAGDWEDQGFQTFTNNNTDFRVTITTFATGTAGKNPADRVSMQPVRKLYYYSQGDLMVAVAGDRAYTAQMATASPSFNACRADLKDKNNTTYGQFSRTPLPISMETVGDLLIAGDGLRPKRFHHSNVPAQQGWPMLGANAPNSAPTVAVGAAGALTGTYLYRQTFIYNGAVAKTPVVSRSYYFESRPVTSGSVAPAAQRVTVTLNANTTETYISYIRLYRTKAGGSTYYRLVDLAVGTASYSDNIADSALGSKTDPDDEGKYTLDTPPTSAIMFVEFGSRAMCVVGKQVTIGGALSRWVSHVGGTNQVRVSKPQLATYTNPNGNDTDDCESSAEHWPNDADHTIVCGSTDGITALVSYRGQIYVFKDDEIGIITGKEPGEYEYDALYPDVGAVPESCVINEGTIYFWSPERGPYSFDGRSFKWIGYQIQPTWLADRGASPGYYCVGVTSDSEKGEIRWSFSNADVHPDSAQLNAAQSNLESVRGTWKEYVLRPATGAWWIHQGASHSRDVRAGCSARIYPSTEPRIQRRRVFFGTTLGMLYRDHETVLGTPYKDPTSNSTQVSITATATFAFVGASGENLDFTKDFELVLMAFVMGAPTTGSIIVAAKLSQSTTFATIATITAATVGTRMHVIDVPKPITENMNIDRGLQVKITSTVNCELKIQALTVRYKEQSPTRKEVRPT